MPPNSRLQLVMLGVRAIPVPQLRLSLCVGLLVLSLLANTQAEMCARPKPEPKSEADFQVSLASFHIIIDITCKQIALFIAFFLN